jgi:hypothetical protein
MWAQVLSEATCALHALVFHPPLIQRRGAALPAAVSTKELIVAAMLKVDLAL